MIEDHHLLIICDCQLNYALIKNRLHIDLRSSLVDYYLSFQFGNYHQPLMIILVIWNVYVIINQTLSLLIVYFWLMNFFLNLDRRSSPPVACFFYYFANYLLITIPGTVDYYFSY